MDDAQLKKLSKIELEELGRTKGIELDRRSNKKTLITQISSLFKKESSTTSKAASSPEPVKSPVKPASRGFRVSPGKSNA